MAVLYSPADFAILEEHARERPALRCANLRRQGAETDAGLLFGNNVLDSKLAECQNALRESRWRYLYQQGAHLIAVTEFLAYGDESGIGGSEPFCLVTGYIASPRQWKAFEREWKDVLIEFGVKRGFHAREFFHRHHKRGSASNEFRDWSDQKANNFIRRLATVIHTKRLYGIGGAVEVAAFIALTLGERRWLTGGMPKATPKGIRWNPSGRPSSPYFLAMQMHVMDALKLAKNGTTVHFVYDRQNVYQSRAVQFHNEMIKTFEDYPPEAPKIGQISHASHVDEVALQAADLRAYLWLAHFVNGYDLSFDRRIGLELLVRKHNQMRFYNAEALELQLSSGIPSATAREAIQAST